MKKGDETTYALLAATQEKEKSRDIFEVAVYAVCVLTTIIAIGQFAIVAKPLPNSTGLAHHHHSHKGHLASSSRPS